MKSLSVATAFLGIAVYAAESPSVSSVASEATKKSFSAGQLIRIERTSPVFAQPRAKSKILADVDPGTLVILKDVSSKGTWLLVEDEDGNAGWVPRNRTQFQKETPAGSKAATKIEAKVPQDQNEIKGPPAPPANFETRRRILSLISHHTANATRLDPTGAWVAGLAFSYLHPMGHLNPKSERVSWLGFSLGILPAWESSRRGFVIPLSYRMWSQSPDSSWGSGPDLGLSFYRMKEPLKNYWGIPLGYSFAWAPMPRGVILSLRAAVEFRNRIRPQLELACGWSL